MGMAEAKKRLIAMYDSEELLRRGAKCPIDGSHTVVSYLNDGMARAGYLKCIRRGHVLIWDCCGKRKGKK